MLPKIADFIINFFKKFSARFCFVFSSQILLFADFCGILRGILWNRHFCHCEILLRRIVAIYFLLILWNSVESLKDFTESLESFCGFL